MQPTRIDVRFKPVGRWISPTFGGLQVRTATATEAVGIDHRRDERVFMFSARDFEGYVVAMSMATAGAIGGYDDPSSCELTGP